MNNKDISIILNVHNEGILVYPTLRSITEAMSKAQSSGLICELLVIADNPPQGFVNLLKEYQNQIDITYNIDWKILEVNNKDLGLSRNQGTKNAEGKYITFIDGDDLWGENWLINCHRFYENQNSEIVLHPELNFIFGNDFHVFFHTDMESLEFDLDYLRIHNYWTALSFGLKSTYEKILFEKNKIKQGFGFEDWNWNCRVVASNIKHKIVPETCHFIRRKKEGSMLQETNENSCLITPHNLFAFN